MNLLVAVGTLITFIYSVYASLLGRPTYYETCCLLITFISFGKFVETRAKNQATTALDELKHLVPDTLHKVSDIVNDNQIIEYFENGKNFQIEKVKSSEIKKDDYIFIAEGESIPADAVVILGKAKVDESMLTGESDLCIKDYKDEITGGTKLHSGQVIARVLHSNDKSTLSKIIQAVIDAQNSKAPVARIADKVAGVFVPCILGLALITFLL